MAKSVTYKVAKSVMYKNEGAAGHSYSALAVVGQGDNVSIEVVSEDSNEDVELNAKQVNHLVEYLGDWLEEHKDEDEDSSIVETED